MKLRNSWASCCCVDRNSMFSLFTFCTNPVGPMTPVRFFWLVIFINKSFKLVNNESSSGLGKTTGGVVDPGDLAAEADVDAALSLVFFLDIVGDVFAELEKEGINELDVVRFLNSAGLEFDLVIGLLLLSFEFGLDWDEGDDSSCVDADG